MVLEDFHVRLYHCVLRCMLCIYNFVDINRSRPEQKITDFRLKTRPNSHECANINDRVVPYEDVNQLTLIVRYNCNKLTNLQNTYTRELIACVQTRQKHTDIPSGINDGKKDTRAMRKAMEIGLRKKETRMEIITAAAAAAAIICWK